jgi:hypothetical protein
MKICFLNRDKEIMAETLKHYGLMEKQIEGDIL